MIRITRKTSYADKLPAYKVLVDDETIGEIRQGETLDFAVSGRHTLQLGVDWCRSRPLQFEADSAMPIEFECWSSASGWNCGWPCSTSYSNEMTTLGLNA